MTLRRVSLTLASIVLASMGSAWAAEYYISPTGSNGGNGGIGSAWATFDYAIDQIDPGDTLYVRGGTYSLSSRIQIRGNEGGTETAPLRIWAYGDETPVLDFSSMSNSLWGQSSGRGIQVDDGADWVHLRGLTIENARDNGIWSGASHGTYERMVTRWNGDSGTQLSGSASHNLILNTDSYENYDPSNNGENADGFAIKFTDLGPGNVVRGARAWGNADDGWDMWESIAGAVTVEDSWAFDNGKLIPRFFDADALEDGDLTAGNFNGDGNGYKLGQDAGPHTLNRVLAWDNQVRGIDVNGNGFGVFVKHSTVYDSGRNWQFDETASETVNKHLLTNNVSLQGSQSDTFQSGVTSESNTWNGISVNAADFLSLDDTIARGPRQADGSLPVSDFLRLAPDSNLIDAGKNIGLPFSGLAPDLGAFETGILGDYNSDGVVNAGDYTVWRDGFGAGFTMADYDVWATHYGEGVVSSVAIPEPLSLLLVIGAASPLVSRRR
ncbi:Pectate lyase L precursor [Botrimarina colliarenosi]|uniref:Pectate lyase L n=1 Tax=Botrimarina colliarenosi TaxID=2528001 RepID=A0A5C6ADG3_9BACT|nr:right-handed parallel beta-helix repeat-containing protein [Botrimarina colliarenosi]TWT97649.1 Pectate lyase L precursor [Botrimarina colliarenosi]